MLPNRQSSTCPDCAGAVTRLPRNAGRGLIWIYRHTLSPLVGYNCRHLPTCSVYADEALDRFGLWGGGWMTLARLLRCQPFGTSGIDNVPEAHAGTCRGDTAAGAASTRPNDLAPRDLLHRFQVLRAILLPAELWRGCCIVVTSSQGGTNNALENQPSRP
jgi:putative membrane protein insertion efficiency factor